MKIQARDLEYDMLNRAVAQCEGYTLDQAFLSGHHCYPSGLWEPSCYWEQGGPIIEREKIDLSWNGDVWEAVIWLEHDRTDDDFVNATGPTALVAAMRCYCLLKLGDVVNVVTAWPEDNSPGPTP